MSNISSHKKTWEKIRARQKLDHDQEYEHKHKNVLHDDECAINPNLSSNGFNHDHEEALKTQMKVIQRFVNTDSEAYFAIKQYEGLEKGVLVNGCKGLGITRVREICKRVREKPAERIRKSKGEYLTGALKMEIQNKGLEWGEWNLSNS